MKLAWPTDAGGGAIPGPGACVDSIRLACARDVDGDASAEVLAEVAYRIVFGSQRDCRAKSSEPSWSMNAIVALSPPTSGQPGWQAKGVVAYPQCNADVCPGSDTLVGFVMLPSGETAVRVSIDSGGGDCAETEYEDIRMLAHGAWKTLARRTTRACDGTREPEENDVY